MKTLKDYLEETIRRYGATGSSPGMGYTLEQGMAEGDVDEGRAIKPVADNAAAAAKLYQYIYRNFEYIAGEAHSAAEKNEGYHDEKLNGLFKTPDGKPIGVIFAWIPVLALIQTSLFIPMETYWTYRDFFRRESFLPKVKAALENPKNSWKDVGSAKPEKEVDEGWKQKVAGAALAGAALAGAAALGAGGAQAQSTDKYDSSWGTSGYDNHIRSDKSLTRSMGSDPSKDVNDFQSRIQNVIGPNAKGEYKVIVIQGNDIVSHYITKTPPPGWLYKEDADSNDPLLAKAIDLAPVSALEESAELRLILQRAKLIE